MVDPYVFILGDYYLDILSKRTAFNYFSKETPLLFGVKIERSANRYQIDFKLKVEP